MILILKSKQKLSSKAEEVIALLLKNLGKANVSAELASLEDIEILISHKKINVLVKGKLITNYKGIFFRKVGNYRNLAFIITNFAKKKEIAFIDRFHFLINNRGKLIQMFFLAANGLPVPKTYHSIFYDNKKIKKAISFLKLPIVVKATNLGGGKMVYLAKNKKELKHILSKHHEMELILQEFIKNNFDYRIMVLGDKAAVAEKRIRTKKGEFRNNASVGGREIFIPVEEISKKISEMAKSAAKIMNVQVAGVDIVTAPNGKNYVLEVNPAPGLSIDVKGSYELDELSNYLILWAKKIS